MTSWEQDGSHDPGREPAGLADRVAAVFLPWLYPGPEPGARTGPPVIWPGGLEAEAGP